MAPRAIWKGHLKLALIVCPVALYKATSDFEGVSFSRFNRRTGHAIKQVLIDGGTAEPVEKEDVARGYNVGTSKEAKFLEVTDEEIEACAPASASVIEITGFVSAARRFLFDSASLPLALVEEHLTLAADGAAAAEAFALIRQAMARHHVVALAPIVRSSKERLAMLSPCGAAMAVTVLRGAMEVRDPADVEGDVGVVIPPRDLPPLVGKIVEAATVDFDPKYHVDRYTDNIAAMVRQKIAGKMIKPAKAEEPPKMADLATAVRKSAESAKSKRKSA